MITVPALTAELAVEESTTRNAKTRLRFFREWCEEREIDTLNDLTGRPSRTSSTVATDSDPEPKQLAPATTGGTRLKTRIYFVNGGHRRHLAGGGIGVGVTLVTIPILGVPTSFVWFAVQTIAIMIGVSLLATWALDRYAG